MTPEHWQQIEAAFNQAIDLPPDLRQPFLDALPPDTRREVLSLLEAENLPLTFTAELASTIEDLQQQDPLNNQRLGPYRILGELGSGGMGSVFKATRDDDAFQKIVAIKIIRANLANTQLESRFLAERQILAQLQHPFIAHLIDGGTHQGLPYIVMEFIEGQPIDAYIRNNNLSIKDRLQLFRKVCEAVQHAHQHLIVHRDLKPGNILVLPDGTPKLLDFGIAKLLDSSIDQQTQTGYLLMTPDYASPEQVRGDNITVSSDVYSLGVILYEILTGKRPYILKNYSPSEIQQAICTGSIPRPNLTTDLDTILLKALHLDPLRRYPSVEKFSEDLRRYLDGVPISARPDTFLYRSTKFIQRNRIAVSLAAILILTVLTGAALVYREGIRAQRRFTQVRTIANRVLTEFDPEASKLPGSTKLRSIMVRASMEYLDSLAAESTADPELQYEVAFAYSRVGDTLGYPRGPNLNQPFEAAIAYNKAINLCLANPSSAKSRQLLAYLYAHYGSLAPRLGKPEQSPIYFDKALALLDGSDPVTRFDVNQTYASYHLLNGDFDRAATAVQNSLAIPTKSISPQAFIHAYNLASEIESYRGNFAAGLAFATKGRDIGLTADQSTVGIMRSLAIIHTVRALRLFTIQSPNLWAPCEAMNDAREGLKLIQKITAADKSDRSAQISQLSAIHAYSNSSAACNAQDQTSLFEQAAEVNKSLNLGSAMLDADRAQLALYQKNYAKAISILKPLLPSIPQQIHPHLIAGEAYLALHRPAAAIAVLEPILAFTRKTAASARFDAIIYREYNLPISLHLGDALHQTNRHAEAVNIWTQALNSIPAIHGKYPIAPSTNHWRNQLLNRLKP
jgi:tRNA A-37 threonylcarbamoyl transferase component Bud32/tetratricopeptide (TPR) repeat protein